MTVGIDEWTDRIGPDECVEALLGMMEMLAAQMRRARKHRSGFDAALEVLNGVVELPAAIVDKDGTVVGGAQPPANVLSHLRALGSSGHSHDLFGWLCLPIHSRDGHYLCVNRPESRITTAQLVAVKEIAALVAFEVHIEEAVIEERARRRGTLADEMLHGVDRQRIATHALELGYDISRPHRVGLIADGRIGLSIEQVRSALRRANVDALSTTWDGCIAVILDSGAVTDTLLRCIDEVVPGGRQWMGLSSLKADGYDLSGAVSEASAALAFGRSAKESRTIDFGELGVFRLFAPEENWSQLESFAVETLRPLLDYDNEHGTDFVHTLDAYLRRNGSLNDLADTLMIHRSTLVYRLRRIRELLAVDIDDSAIRLDLSLAARALEVLQTVSPNTSSSVGL